LRPAWQINATMYTYASYFFLKKSVYRLFNRSKAKEITSQYREKRYHFFLKGLYEYYCAKYETNPKLIVFADDRSPVIPDNMAGLYQRFRGEGYECVTVLPKTKKSKYAVMRQFETLSYCNRFTKIYAQAKIVFLVEYFLPVYPNPPRNGCQVVQLWHACGAFKRFGYSTATMPWGPDVKELDDCPAHTHYSLVPVSAPECISKYAEAFHCSEEIVLPLGVPRTDIFFQHGYSARARADLLAVFPEIGNRNIILYAPTFRGDTIDQGNFDLHMNYKMLKEALADNYVMINKFHPLTRNVNGELEKDGDGGFAYDITSLLPIEKALAAADVVITDYSSIIFEYSLFNKPMIFFAYDLEEYFVQRNFYYDYETFVPGPIAKTTEEIIRQIQNIDRTFDPERVRVFREKFMSSCDGNSVDRIFKHLISRM